MISPLDISKKIYQRKKTSFYNATVLQQSMTVVHNCDLKCDLQKCPLLITCHHYVQSFKTSFGTKNFVAKVCRWVELWEARAGFTHKRGKAWEPLFETIFISGCIRYLFVIW